MTGNTDALSNFLGFCQVNLCFRLFCCEGGETGGQENRECRCTNHVQTPIDNND
ncbi:MAG: hypothetical protein AW09_001853 [Candidatus Accumulibacter phosphatis]|uniref:Uncharacterized protein n=1 Tax=Candidatus Accumulibacter phosphatis TaxID=327160 RepID=A0A080M733_9PROT|nr:MAG: hypothetical protein AW09_001853 [Candidatus Accumulibacter phosphatis]